MAGDNKVVNLSSKEAIYLKASEWIVLMEERDLSSNEIDRLREWLRESPQHRAALLGCAKVWDRMDAMVDLADLLPLDQPVRTKRTRLIYAFVAMAAVAIAAPLIYRLSAPESAEGTDPSFASDQSRIEWSGSYATDIGELEEIDLVDGSRVTLNTATQIDVDFGAAERAVHLVGGEAHFDVIHNETLPFVVYVDGTSVEAIGTAFTVQKLSDHLQVTVTEGLVEVSFSPDYTETVDERAGEPVLIRAGQLVEVEANVVTPVQEYEPEVIARRMLWQESMLAFNGESLQGVVEEFERYTNINLEIADAETAAIRVGGYFRSGDVPGLLTSLENNFSVSVEQVSSDTFLLRLEPL